MNRVQIRSTMIRVLELNADTSQVLDSRCLECDSPMDMHQPNSDDPEIFLGVCAECGRWFRIEVDVEGDRIWCLAVPGKADVEPSDPG
jgi:hypothetical protein